MVSGLSKINLQRLNHLLQLSHLLLQETETMPRVMRTKQRPHHELRCKKLHETETTPRVTLQEAARNRDHTTSYAARSCTKQRPRHELCCKKLHETETMPRVMLQVTETTPRVMLQETITRSYVRILKETSIRQHTFCELNISQVYLEMRKRLQYSAVPILENTHNSDD